MTKNFSNYVFDIGVSYREDVDEVIEVIKGVDEELRKDPAFRDDITEPIEVLGLDSFGDSAVIIKARTTTKPIRQWNVAREFNRRLKKAFDAKNIEMRIPPHPLICGQRQGGRRSPSVRRARKAGAESSRLPPNSNKVKRLGHHAFIR